MSTKNLENKELLNSLKEVQAIDKSASKTDIVEKVVSEAKIAKTELKQRELKDIIKFKRESAIVKADRKIEQQHRSYIVYNTDEKHANVYYSTTYFNTLTQKEEQLNVHIMRKLRDDIVAKMTHDTRFTTATIQKMLQTKGSNYCDFIRNTFYEISLLTTKDAVDKDLSAVMLKAQEHKKLLIRYNTIQDSRHAKYEFIKV